MEDSKRTTADGDELEDEGGDRSSAGARNVPLSAINDGVALPAKEVVDDDRMSNNEATEDSFRETQEPRHKTILGGDATLPASVSLCRCALQDCCDNKVHCPFCDVRQYKPTQPSRVRDHLHLTHFQHAVYYDGMMIVKCFHACRESGTKGGHYHCPVCGTTLLKRNAFTTHLLSHASKQGLNSGAVQAPDAKKPSVVYYDDHKISLCHAWCVNTTEPHFHCPLCQQSCAQLSSLTAHLWRCEKRATSIAAKVDMTGYSLNVPKLFSAEMAQCMPHLKDLKEYKWHLSIVRNLSDLPLVRCTLPDCCKGRYHCPLCTTAKLKPNHLSHMRQHFVSHWRSGVPFKSYNVLVCYLPCELKDGVDKIRFHYHCPLCGATRRRRHGFARHLQICDPTRPADLTAEEEEEEEEEESFGDDAEEALGKFTMDGDILVPLSDTDAVSSQSAAVNLLHLTTSTSRRASADQAELQAAESLVDMDLRIQMETLNKSSSSVNENGSSAKQLVSKNVERIEDAVTSDANTKSKDQTIQGECCDGKDDSLDQQTEFLEKGSDCVNGTDGVSISKGMYSQNVVEWTEGESRDKEPHQSKHRKLQSKMTDPPEHVVTTGSSRNSSGSVIEKMETESLGSYICLVELDLRAEKGSRDTDALDHGMPMDVLGTFTSSPHHVAQEPNKTGSDSLKDKTLTESGKENTDCLDHDTDADSLVGTWTASDPISQKKSVGDSMRSSPVQAREGVSCGHAESTCVQTSLDTNRPPMVVLKTSVAHVLNLPSQDYSPETDSSHGDHLCLKEDQMSVNFEGSQPSPSHDGATGVDLTLNSGDDRSSFPQKGNEEETTIEGRLLHGDSSAAEEGQNSGSNTTANMQIFQQVSTQISNNIVQELQNRGILEQSLQVIGQLCKVAWQQNGDMVMMTCDLEELCRAQSYFKQILKEGLQNFPDTLLEQGRSKLNNDQTPPPDPKPARKRGRPKGSKNKATLLKEEEEGFDRSGKFTKQSREAASFTVSAPTHRQNVCGSQLHNKGTKKAVDPHKAAKDQPVVSQYSGRTRGKRINFAQLNAGNMSPSHDNSVGKTKTPPEIAVETPHAESRGRGRPRRIHPVVEGVPSNSQGTDPQPMNGRTQGMQTHCHDENRQGSLATSEKAVRSAAKSYSGKTQRSSAGESVENVLESCLQPSNEKLQEMSSQNIVGEAAAADPDSVKNGENIVIVQGEKVQDVSGITTDPKEPQTMVSDCQREVVWVPCMSAIKRKMSQGGCNTPSMPVVITTPKAPPTPVLTRPNLKLPANVSLVDGKKSKQSTSEGERREAETEKTGRAKSPAITRRTADLYQLRHGTDSFAIIPTVIFDFTEDAEENRNPKPPEQNDSSDNSADVRTSDGDAALEEEAVSEEQERNEEMETKTDNAATQTRQGSETLYRCPVCMATHESYVSLTTHLSARHPNKRTLGCDVCQIVCPTPGALTLHLQQRHGPRPQVTVSSVAAFRCSSCGKECVSSSSLHWHRTLVHKEESEARSVHARLKCGLCNYVAIDRWDKRHHREQHRDQPATCIICAKTFGTEASLKLHLSAKHAGHSYACPLCHKTFAHPRYLRTHLQRHGGEKRHVCPICGWRFFQTNTLRAHMDTHKPKMQRRYAFRCPHCPAAYNSQANYRDHLNKHTGERPHVCSQCGRGFAFRSMLTTHMAFVHSSLRPHSCTECDKKYKTKTQLRQHQMTHTMARTGKSPFMCAKCGRPMASKSRLQAHSRRCKGGNFMWHQKLAAVGQQAKVQAVNIVAGQPVNLVDLLPGQHINVVHHGFGKEATLTLVPVQNEAVQNLTVIGAEDQTSLQDEQMKVNELSRMEISSEAVNVSAGGSGVEEPQQAVLVSGSVSSENCLGDARDGAHPGITVISTSGSCSTHVVQNNQAVSLLSNAAIASVKELSSGNNDPAYDTSTNMTQPLTMSDTQTFISGETFPTETLLQTAAPSHQLVLSDRFGQTQTVLLSSDLAKQEEVVVIETEGGHQNILNFSNVQFIQADSIQHQPDTLLEENRNDNDRKQEMAVLQPSGAEGTLVFQTSTEPQHDDGNLSTEQSREGPEEASLYICSLCDQQFSSMDLAQQHVYLCHTLEETTSEPMETQAVMNLTDEQQVT